MQATLQAALRQQHGDIQQSSGQRAPGKGCVTFGRTTTISGGDKEISLQASGPLARERPLRRSPTPLVHSLVELQEEHANQLGRVWKEAGLPDPVVDQAEISQSLEDLGVLRESETAR